jgi:transcriptional regulator with XRE-family HTH domain
MLRTNVPTGVRHLRRKRGWRQIDLARRSDISRQVLSRLERGQLASLSMRTVTRVAEALDATVHVTLRWHGEELDRLVDAAHAAIVQHCVELFDAAGWVSRIEVSFNHYGDRGRVDVLALHPATRALVVVEAKSAVGDGQETLGRLDVKVRLAPMLAEQLGWPRPARVVPALVIGDSRRARRLLAEHDRLFALFDVRGRQALAWIRHPERGAPDRAPSGLIWFANVPNARPGSITRVARVRTGRNQP